MFIPDPHPCSRDSTHGVTSLRVRAMPAQTKGCSAPQPRRARKLQHANVACVFLLADVSASVQGHPAPGARPGLVTPAGCREDEEGERRKVRGTAPAWATGAGWDSWRTWVSPSVMGGRGARIPSRNLFGTGGAQPPRPHPQAVRWCAVVAGLSPCSGLLRPLEREGFKLARAENNRGINSLSVHMSGRGLLASCFPQRAASTSSVGSG